MSLKIDDYGSALIGTGTIDLYKTNRLAMRKWGVRSVDIDVIEWGSKEKSLQVLAPRRKIPASARMILALSKNASADLPAVLDGLSFDSGEVRRTFRG